MRVAAGEKVQNAEVTAEVEPVGLVKYLQLEQKSM